MVAAHKSRSGGRLRERARRSRRSAPRGVTCQQNSRCAAASSGSRVTPLLGYGWLWGLGRANRRRHSYQVVAIALRVVATHVHELGHEPAHLSPFEVHEQLHTLADAVADGGVGQVDAGLEDA